MAKTLTAAAVEKLKPDPNKRIEVSDGLIPALRVVIAPNGGKSYAVRFKHLGRPKKLTIGPVGAFSLTEARSRAREALCEVAHGKDPCELKRPRALPLRPPLGIPGISLKKSPRISSGVMSQN